MRTEAGLIALALPYRNIGTEGFEIMRASLCSRLQDVFSGAVGWYRGLRDLQPQGNDNIPVPDPSFIRVATLDGPFTTLHLRALHCPMGLPTHCHSHHCCCGKDKTKAHRFSVGCQATFSLVSRGGKDDTDGLLGLRENWRWEEQMGNQRRLCTLRRSSDQVQGRLRARDPPH